jgi:hypothetical protein
VKEEGFSEKEIRRLQRRFAWLSDWCVVTPTHITEGRCAFSGCAGEVSCPGIREEIFVDGQNEGGGLCLHNELLQLCPRKMSAEKLFRVLSKLGSPIDGPQNWLLGHKTDLKQDVLSVNDWKLRSPLHDKKKRRAVERGWRAALAMSNQGVAAGHNPLSPRGAIRLLSPSPPPRLSWHTSEMKWIGRAAEPSRNVSATYPGRVEEGDGDHPTAPTRGGAAPVVRPASFREKISHLMRSVAETGAGVRMHHPAAPKLRWSPKPRSEEAEGGGT